MAEDLETCTLKFEPKVSLHSAPHAPLTEEYVTVIKGNVKITAGDNTADLKAGGFTLYHCDIEHSIENLLDSNAEIHMVVRFNKKHWG